MKSQGNDGCGKNICFSYAGDIQPFAESLLHDIGRTVSDTTITDYAIDTALSMDCWNVLACQLRQSRALIVLMSPGALQAPLFRRQWLYARQEGLFICPVWDIPRASFENIRVPAWMRSVRMYALPDERDAFFFAASQPPVLSRIPFMAPEPPLDYVKPEPQYEQLITHLLGAGRETPAGIVSDISGALGLGKTSLAAAVCHDDRIIDTFDGGILWLAHQEGKTLENVLERVYATVSGNPSGHRKHKMTAEIPNNTYALLAAGSVLTVMDDGWAEEDVRVMADVHAGLHERHLNNAFLVVAQHAELQASCVKTVYAVSLRGNDNIQVLPLLNSSRDAPKEAKQSLIKKTGYCAGWPLGARLAGAFLNELAGRGVDYADALDTLAQAVERHEIKWNSFDILIAAYSVRGPWDRTRKIDAELVSKCVAMNLELLEPDFRRCCTELGIFPEHADVSFSVVATLWRQSLEEALNNLEHLARLSLLQIDVSRGCFFMHAAIRHSLLALLFNSQEVHLKLLRAWDDMPELSDDYMRQHVMYHLFQAGRRSDVRRLLTDMRWLTAQYEGGDCIALKNSSAYMCSLEPDSMEIVSAQLVDILLQGKGLHVSGAVRWLCSRPGRYYGCTLPLPRENHVVCAVKGGPIEVYDINSQECLTVMKGHTSRATVLRVSSEGAMCVSASCASRRDNSIRVWDTGTGMPLHVFSDGSAPLNSLYVTPAASHVVAAYEDGAVRLWDVKRGTLTGEFSTIQTAHKSVFCSHDAQYAFLMSSASTLDIWNVPSKVKTATICTQDTAWGSYVVSSEDGSFLAVRDGSSFIKIIDMAKGVILRSFPYRTPSDAAFTFTPDSRCLALASGRRKISLWDIESGKTLRMFEGLSDPVIGLSFVSGGRYLLGHSVKRTILWDAVSAEVVFTMQHATEHDGPQAFLITPDMAHVLVDSWAGCLQCIDLKSGCVLRSVERAGTFRKFLTMLDEQHVLLALNRDVVEIWNLNSMESVARVGDYFSGHPHVISSDRRTLAFFDGMSVTFFRFTANDRGVPEPVLPRVKLLDDRTDIDG